MGCDSQTPLLVDHSRDSGDRAEDSGDHPGDGGWLSWGWLVTILLMVGNHPGIICDHPWDAGSLPWQCWLTSWVLLVTVIGILGDCPWDCGWLSWEKFHTNSRRIPIPIPEDSYRYKMFYRYQYLIFEWYWYRYLDIESNWYQYPSYWLSYRYWYQKTSGIGWTLVLGMVGELSLCAKFQVWKVLRYLKHYLSC